MKHTDDDEALKSLWRDIATDPSKRRSSFDQLEKIMQAPAPKKRKPTKAIAVMTKPVKAVRRTSILDRTRKALALLREYGPELETLVLVGGTILERISAYALRGTKLPAPTKTPKKIKK